MTGSSTLIMVLINDPDSCGYLVSMLDCIFDLIHLARSCRFWHSFIKSPPKQLITTFAFDLSSESHIFLNPDVVKLHWLNCYVTRLHLFLSQISSMENFWLPLRLSCLDVHFSEEFEAPLAQRWINHIGEIGAKQGIRELSLRAGESFVLDKLDFRRLVYGLQNSLNHLRISLVACHPHHAEAISELAHLESLDCGYLGSRSNAKIMINGGTGNFQFIKKLHYLECIKPYRHDEFFGWMDSQDIMSMKGLKHMELQCLATSIQELSQFSFMTISSLPHLLFLSVKLILRTMWEDVFVSELCDTIHRGLLEGLERGYHESHQKIEVLRIYSGGSDPLSENEIDRVLQSIPNVQDLSIHTTRPLPTLAGFRPNRLQSLTSLTIRHSIVSLLNPEKDFLAQSAEEKRIWTSTLPSIPSLTFVDLNSTKTMQTLSSDADFVRFVTASDGENN